MAVLDLINIVRHNEERYYGYVMNGHIVCLLIGQSTERNNCRCMVTLSKPATWLEISLTAKEMMAGPSASSGPLHAHVDGHVRSM